MNLSQKILAIGSAAKNFLGQGVDTITCLARVLIESKRPENTFYGNNQSDSYVLGTGPSLSDDMKLVFSKDRAKITVICVNEFYKSVDFKTVRPDHFVIADPEYWSEALFDTISKGIVESLAEVDWHMVFWLPVKAKFSMFDCALRRKNANIVYYNTTPLTGGPVVGLALFRKKLAMPRPQNVLVAAISISIWIGSKTINLLGADHDWHREIALSTDGVLQIRTNHTYHRAANYRPFYKPFLGQINEEKTVFTVSEIFQAWATVHQSYEYLRQLSQKCGVKIFNCSSNSFIDAFERKI